MRLQNINKKLNKLTLTFLACSIPFAVHAKAEPLKVELNGVINTQAGYAKESKYYRYQTPTLMTAPGAPPVSPVALESKAITNDTLINIGVHGQWQEGITYGGLIRLHANQSEAANKETTVGDKAMIFWQNEKIGRLEAGNYPGAAAAFEMEVPTFETGAGGIDGYWSQWVSGNTKKTVYNAGVQGNQFITNPNIPTNYSGQYYSDAPKVTFYTKPFKNLTVGVSYIPDLDSRGGISGIAYKNAGPTDSERSGNPATFREIVSGGITYEHFFTQDWSAMAALVGEVGKAKDYRIHALKAGEASLQIKYKDYRVTTSYGDAGKTFSLKQPLPGSKHKATYWTIAFGQQIDKLGYTISYMNSKRAGGLEAAMTLPNMSPLLIGQFTDYRSNKLDIAAFDVDYKLAEGLMPYAGIASFKFRGTKLPIKDVNEGYVVMAGTKLSF